MKLIDCGPASVVTRGNLFGACTEATQPPFTHWGPTNTPFCPWHARDEQHEPAREPAPASGAKH